MPFVFECKILRVTAQSFVPPFLFSFPHLWHPSFPILVHIHNGGISCHIPPGPCSPPHLSICTPVWSTSALSFFLIVLNCGSDACIQKYTYKPRSKLLKVVKPSRSIWRGRDPNLFCTMLLGLLSFLYHWFGGHCGEYLSRRNMLNFDRTIRFSRYVSSEN